MIREKWYFQPAEYPIIPLSELKDFLIKHLNWRLYKDFVNDVMKEDIVLLEGIKLYTPSS